MKSIAHYTSSRSRWRFLTSLMSVSLLVGCQKGPTPETRETTSLVPPTASTPSVRASATIDGRPGIEQTVSPTRIPTTDFSDGIASLWVVGVEEETNRGLLYSLDVGCLEQSLPCPEQPVQVLAWPTPIFALKWSLDGKKMAFEAFDGTTRQREIYIYSPSAGIEPEMITGNVDGQATSPAWSSNGEMLYFALGTKNSDEVLGYEIKNATLERNILPVHNVSSIGSLALSPQGLWAFHAYGEGQPKFGVYIYSPSSGLNQIAPQANLPGGAAGPQFSRNGALMSYVRQAIDQTGTNIVVVTTDGLEAIDITNEVGVQNGVAAWSPISEHLVYASNRDTGIPLVADLWISDTSGAVRVKLLTPTEIDAQTIIAYAWRLDR